jgi:hypothetical protein
MAEAAKRKMKASALRLNLSESKNTAPSTKFTPMQMHLLRLEEKLHNSMMSVASHRMLPGIHE